MNKINIPLTSYLISYFSLFHHRGNRETQRSFLDIHFICTVLSGKCETLKIYTRKHLNGKKKKTTEWTLNDE